jgi:hypothetical protein
MLRRRGHMRPNSKLSLIALMAEVKKSGWIVISTKKDWKVIFPFEGK